ncbi:hypothetical protein SH449x_003073 [Pirellulaceae bacterium SH449]
MALDEVLVAGRAAALVATASFDLLVAFAALVSVGLELDDLAFLALVTAEVALAGLAAAALLDLDFLDEDGDDTEFATERAKGNLEGKKIEQ